MAEEIPPLHPSAFDSADYFRYALSLSPIWTRANGTVCHNGIGVLLNCDRPEGPVQLSVVPNVYKMPTYLQRLDEGVRQEIYRFCTAVLYPRNPYCCAYTHPVCKVCTWNALFDETEIRHERCPNMSLCSSFFEQRKRKLQP